MLRAILLELFICESLNYCFFLMFIVCYDLFFITYSSSVEHSIGRWAYQSLLIAICFLCLVLFGSENVASASFPINKKNKGR